MAPKKKGNKKGNDDWEAELGESIAPASPAAENTVANGAHDDAEDENAGAGGLMGLMRKKKEKRKQKGLSEDFVEGEDPSAAVPEPEPAADLTTKAPEEANLDDEFALPEKKGKGGKGKAAQQIPTAKAAPVAAPTEVDGGDEDDAEGGRVLTKAEKEKLKKEREKQRKKEQVCWRFASVTILSAGLTCCRRSGCEEEGWRYSRDAVKHNGTIYKGGAGQEERGTCSSIRGWQEEEATSSPSSASEATRRTATAPRGGRPPCRGRKGADRGGREAVGRRGEAKRRGKGSEEAEGEGAY
jgi:hypothetical protein